MPDDYLELPPEVVAAAGQRTATTGGAWSGWASQVGTRLRLAAADARDTTVTGLVEGHLSTLQPRLHRLAGNAEALGTNATAASVVVADADATSATVLRGHTDAAATAGSLLRRPVNGGDPATGAVAG